MGVSVFEGAEVHLFRNRVEENGDLGLSLEGGASASAGANWIVQNRKGVRVDSSNLELFDSLIARSSDPDEGSGIVAEDSRLDVFNTTIFENAGFGIELSGSRGTIANSILYQNNIGEFTGSFPDQILHNLIGDGQFEGVDGNFTGDPLFADPTQLDVSPQEGSPVIDRGTHDVSISVGDLNSHRRVVDGDGDRVVRVDLGSVEFGSGYTEPLLFPILSIDEAEFVGLAAANGFHLPTRMLLRGYDQNGNLFDTFEKEIPAGNQFSILLREAFENLREGWVEVLSTQPDQMGFTMLGERGLYYMDGADLSRAVGPSLLFPEVHVGNSQTSLYLINPGDQTLDIVLKWIRPDGSSNQVIRRLPAHGSLSETVEELFGNISGWSGFAGYITAEALDPSSGHSVEIPIFGMELFGDEITRAGLLAQGSRDGPAEVFGVHFVSLEDLETHINVINLGLAAKHITSTIHQAICND